MQIEPVQTTKPKARVALQGAYGSGKSYSALLLAHGLTGAYERIVVIETNYKAAYHYSFLGAFNTLTINAPYTPEKFIDALELCEHSGVGVVIIDSLSQEWIGLGGMQERIKEEAEEALHYHNALMQKIERSPCHIFCTLQTEEEYQLKGKKGSATVIKLGLQPLQREDIHSYFHTVLSLTGEHKVTPLKDRTSFFEEHKGVVITDEIAALYARWCTGNQPITPSDPLLTRINECKTVGELLEIMFSEELDDSTLLQACIRKRRELETLKANPIYSLQNHFTNGNSNHRA